MHSNWGLIRAGKFLFTKFYFPSGFKSQDKTVFAAKTIEKLQGKFDFVNKIWDFPINHFLGPPSPFNTVQNYFHGRDPYDIFFKDYQQN